jgi:hypothetical protein
MYRYVLPVEQSEWRFEGAPETCFTWQYDDEREALLKLYDCGKKQQWDAALRIDWEQDLGRDRCRSDAGERQPRRRGIRHPQRMAHVAPQ